METRTTGAIPLAPRPDIEQYKRLAKELVTAARTDAESAITAWSSDWIRRLATLQVESSSWEYVDRTTGQPSEREIDREAGEILTEFKTAPISGDHTLANGQLFLARLHGFDSWPRFSTHVEGLVERNSTTWRFEAAADAITSGNIGTLRELLKESPELVRERSTRDHRATLLHYVAANGHEGFRQRTPANAVEIARLLLDAGAAPDAQANMYGQRTTTMEMLVSSVHPHNAGVHVALADVLIDYGASVNGVDDDGSPMMTAFRFGYPDVGEALARRGARIDSVIAAAALGRADLVDQMVDDHGRLRYMPDATRPWPTLTSDPGQHMGFALAWATAFGRDGVVELLIRKGVDPAGKDDDMPALHYAAAHGRMHLVRRLVSAGASLESLNSYGGTVLSGMMWFAYESPIAGVDYRAVARELIALGARTDFYPEMKEDLEPIIQGRVPIRRASPPDLPSSP